MGKNYVLASDGSDNATHAVDYVREYLSPESDHLTVLKVSEDIPQELAHEGESLVKDPGEVKDELTEQSEAIVHEIADSLQDDGFNVDTVTVFGDPGTEICQYAENSDADGIILGRRGHGGVRELLLGSVSQYVVHHASCPVVIVPNSIYD